MTQMNTNILFKEESFEIIGACMEVHNELGCGFLEPVYQEALEIIFKEKRIPFEREKELEISFHGNTLKKKYYADFVCYGGIILELKAINELNSQHTAQVLNYLKVTGFSLGLLINFGDERLNYKRVVK